MSLAGTEFPDASDVPRPARRIAPWAQALRFFSTLFAYRLSLAAWFLSLTWPPPGGSSCIQRQIETSNRFSSSALNRLNKGIF
jgi:hypothetical protein